MSARAAAVILCVRGLDPFLPACLKGLLSQDYPKYDVWIVVDSTRDPAWPVVNKLAQQSGKPGVGIFTLTERLATSSRKIAGMLQAMTHLESRHEIVALLDSDTIPHDTWLRELAAPLKDPRVGVSSGNRWYMPAKPTVGALVRYLWNAAAVVQMYWYKIGWGGSLAINTTFLRNSDLRQRLAKAFGEDSTICRAPGPRIPDRLRTIARDGESGGVRCKRCVWFPPATNADRATAQSVVVGRRWAWHCDDGHAGTFLPAGCGRGGHHQVECGNLDWCGRGCLLGLDGLDGSALGVVRAAHTPASR